MRLPLEVDSMQPSSKTAERFVSPLASPLSRKSSVPRIPNILVYFGHTPSEGPGSAIIILRHLRRFADGGWDVRVIADWGQDHRLCHEAGWPVKELSFRRSWWPPFNPDNSVSRSIRAWLWAGEVRTWVGSRGPASVLTYLSAFGDSLPMAAVGFARRFGYPLATIVHDDARCFVQNEKSARSAHARRNWVIQNSSTAWFASPALASCFSLPKTRAGILPPIPEGRSSASRWRQEFAENPLVVYAGNYWTPQLPLLARLGREIATAGGRLLLLVKNSLEIEALCNSEPILWREPFRENCEALDFLTKNAAGLLVSYAETSEVMPWIRTSFPSKLIEYTHLGIPIMICAPEDSAVAKWASERNHPDFATPSAPGTLIRFVEALKDPAAWHKKGDQSKRYAATEFDPVQIQETLAFSLHGGLD